LKKKLFFFLKYIIFLSIGFGLFWLSLKDADFNEIWKYFKNAHYFWVFLSILTMMFSHVIRAIRWNQLIHTLGYKTKTHTTLYAVLIGYFVNLAVPRLGEITRCGVLANHNKIPVNQVIGTVIAERAFDVLSLLVILLITIFSQLFFLSDFLYENVFNPIISKFSSATAALLIIGGISIGIILVFAVLYRLFLSKLRTMKLFQKIVTIIKGFWSGILTIKNIKQKKLFIFNTVIMWCAYSLTIYVSFFAIKETSHLTPVDALTIMALGSIGVLAPTPGGIGAYQYVVKTTLIGLFLVPATAALSFANLMYFTQWFMIITVGGISWILIFISQKKNEKNEKN